MQMRKLGSTGLVTSAIGFNCLSFTTGCAPIDRTEAMAIISQLPDIGINLIDASDFTVAGDVETLVGRAVRARRDEVLLASRGGARWTSAGVVRSVDASPAALRRACDATLRRLGVGHIDLYYLAQVDPGVPLDESMGALADLVTAGKIHHVGLCGVSDTELRRAAAIHPVAAVAAEYSLLQRTVEDGLLTTAVALGVGLTAYSPLGRGLLTGWLTSLEQLFDGDYRLRDPRFQPERFTHNRSLTEAFERLAAGADLSVSRLALAWLLARSPAIVAMPGTRTLTHVEMNASAADVLISEGLAAHLSLLTGPAGVAEFLTVEAAASRLDGDAIG